MNYKYTKKTETRTRELSSNREELSIRLYSQPIYSLQFYHPYTYGRILKIHFPKLESICILLSAVVSEQNRQHKY